MLVTPYKEYSNNFADAVRKSKALLIVGYSFGDLHVNVIISRITALHGENRKIVIITFVPPRYKRSDNWHINSLSMLKEMGGWLGTNEMYFYCRASEDGANPLGNITFEYKDYSVSQNGKVRIYFEGFEKAVTKYANEIIEFLTT